MPRGQYERKPKSLRLAETLREIADEVEAELGKVEQAKAFLKNMQFASEDVGDE